MLIAHKARLDDETCHGVTPLISSAQCGDLGIVKILLEKGALTDLQSNLGNTALRTAVS